MRGASPSIASIESDAGVSGSSPPITTNVFNRLFIGVFITLIAIPSSLHAQPAVYEKPSDIPVEVFAALPTFSSALLSPSGKKLGYYVSMRGRRHLVAQNLDGSNRSLIPPWDKKLELGSYFWKSDDLIVFSLSMTLNRRVFRGKTTETRIMSFNLATEEFRWLGKPKGRSRKVSQLERIVDRLVDDPSHILLQLDFDLDTTPSVYKVNIETGKRKRRKGGRRGINNWYTDQNSVIRFGAGYRPDSSKYNATFRTTEGKWIDLTKVDWADEYNIEGFSEDANILYVSGLSAYGTIGLFRLDIRSGEIIDSVFAHEKVDMGNMFNHPVTGRLAGVIYVDDFYRIKYFDKTLSSLQRSFTKALPGENITIVGKARDAEKYLVFADSDTNPGDYYYYDRSNRQLDWIAAYRASIDASMMSPVKQVSIPVRDNSEIPAYLTQPNGGKTPENLPAIILPHGGPHARDNAEWDWWSQFYASRGYLVLQPNFRGSEGYGPAYENAGKKQWGGLMQDDVTDATRWLIAEGMADPERICIAGASYGGYAALMGVIKETELYRCAISVNGVTSLPRLKSEDRRRTVGSRAWTKNMGLEGVEDKAVSPYHRADEITVPVLLISSVDDARVPYEHSEDMHNKLKRLRKDSQYVKLENGAHSMLTAESRLITLRETENFLREHIGDRR